jgi:hypothetical protein
MPSDQHLWSGYVAFDEGDFEDRSRFPDITRTDKPSRGRKGLTGGRLHMEADGLHWKAGSLRTPGSQLDGTFYLPWSVIESFQVARIPYTLPVGGAVTISLQGGSHLYGEYQGSQKRLIRAIKESPAELTD